MSTEDSGLGEERLSTLHTHCSADKDSIHSNLKLIKQITVVASRELKTDIRVQ